ncbi:MAG TPA: histidine kinase dimerization/phosphoacceptor domain -containing protein [Caulobacteraceae bacterium]|jgi:PAS domain S-box-containing protein
MNAIERLRTGAPIARLARDVAYSWRVQTLTSQVALGVGLVAVVTVVGWALRAILPSAFPAALLFPAILLASLVGGWRAGATAGVASLMARTFSLQPQHVSPILSEGTTINFVLFALAAGAVVAIGVYPRSLLERLRQSRDALTERNLHYRSLFDNIPEGFAVCDAIRDARGQLVDYTIVEINPALQRLLGVGDEVIGSRLTDRPANWTRWLQVCDQALTTGKPISFERYNRVSKRWHEVRVSALTGKRMAQFFFDITERKAEEARQTAAFDELNHRVKNNLAMVAGLLQLQARGSRGQVRDHLVKAAARVQSIAEVHDALSRGAGADSIDFGAYLQDLCASLRRSLAIEDRIALRVETEPEILAVDTAISLGMVVNELVTNAAKYAYPEGAAGEIMVGFVRAGDQLLLTVRDNGRGLPSEPGPGGLGMRLVGSLLDKLGGELRLQEGQGAGFEIRIPLVADLPAAVETVSEPQSAL